VISDNNITKKKPFIIAEMSSNHNNDYNLAVKTIESMADSGADAVKLQTYQPKSLTLDLNSGYFAPFKEGIWKGFTPWNLYKEASMPYEWQSKLKKIAEDKGLVFFSSPFDFEGVDFLNSLNVPIFKIASLEIVDIPLIRYCASKKKPMIISTGVAGLEDIKLALTTCRNEGNNNITLLKCTSDYPAKIADANIVTILDMKKRFDVEVGVSDHTLGSIVPVVATCLGATIIEKHFILDRKLGGPDAAFSMEPLEFKKMVKDINDVQLSLGRAHYEVSEKDRYRRRSLFVVKDIKKGEKITDENVRSIRPGYGIHPKYYYDVLGKTVKFDIAKGTPFTWELIK